MTARRRAAPALLAIALVMGCWLPLLVQAEASSEHVWVIQLDDGGEMAAREIASSHPGLEFQGRVPHLRNKFVFKLDSESPVDRDLLSSTRRKRSVEDHEIVRRSLELHPKVSWISYQTELKRDKRDFLAIEQPQSRAYQDFASEFEERASVDGLGNRAVGDFSPSDLNRHAERLFVDPLWPNQWYLHDTRSSPSLPKLDLHVIPAWRKNLTGRGVVVAVVDDGLERDHPDLVANYDARASYNYNKNTPDPQPRYADIEDERHGTRCAGEVAMSANNSYCGVGVAFNCRLGGVKILDGHVNDLLEARGLSHAMDYVDIYSASWGPSDDGKTFEAPGPLAAEALEAGVERGRGGKGVLYVWASGNGGAFGDNCNCDGYASSVYTIAVSSATNHLSPPWYSEHCSATLATTFSSGSSKKHRMVSTDLQHKCTTEFTGTSASAPIASGIIALLLEANPNLTWRDVQHAIVWTAEVAPLLRNPEWQRNAAGHKFHHHFGFGLFNVGAMTDLVDPATWRNVPAKSIVRRDRWQCSRGWRLRQQKAIRCSLNVDVDVEERVKFLEHVQLRVKMEYPERGALAISITSPSGTRSQLLTRRKHDTNKGGLPSWAFMSVHFWGENPSGEWVVLIEDQSNNGSHDGRLEDLELILHGTATAPDYRVRAGGYRKYNHMYNYVKNMVEDERQRPASAIVESLGHFYHRLFDSSASSRRVRPEPSHWLQKVATFH